MGEVVPISVENKIAADMPAPCPSELNKLLPLSELKSTRELDQLNDKMRSLEREFQTAMTELKKLNRETKPPKPTLRERVANMTDRQLLEAIFLYLHTPKKSKVTVDPIATSLNNRL